MAVMNPPNLTSDLLVDDPAPVFVGTYSHVLKGAYRGRIVAIKVIRPLEVPLPSMRRVSPAYSTEYALKYRRKSAVSRRFGFRWIIHTLFLFLALHPKAEYLEISVHWSPHGTRIETLEGFSREKNAYLPFAQWEGVVAGVCHLHTYSPVIIHGDLKPGNILIDDEGNPKICDFGLVHIFLEEGHSGHTTTSEHTGTDRYLAYELVMFPESGKISAATDVWALGCVGLEFLYSEVPYKSHKTNRFGSIFQDIRNGIPPATEDTISANVTAKESLLYSILWGLLNSCWELQASKRATAGSIYEVLMQFPHPILDYGGADGSNMTLESTLDSQEQQRSSERSQSSVERDPNTVNPDNFQGSKLMEPGHPSNDVSAASTLLRRLQNSHQLWLHRQQHLHLHAACIHCGPCR